MCHFTVINKLLIDMNYKINLEVMEGLWDLYIYLIEVIFCQHQIQHKILI